MQLTSLLVCLMTTAVIQAVPIPSNDASLSLVKRVTTAKPAAKPAAAKPVAAKPVAAKPVAAKPVAAPVKAPVKAPAKAATGTAPASGAADVCTGISKRAAPCKCFKKCNSCTANPQCAFSTVTFTCVDKGTGTGPADSIIQSEAAKKCPAVQQQTGVFPVIAAAGKPDTIAGLPSATIKAEFAKIEPHVFTRESASRPDSGQHLRSVWEANHTGAKAVAACNTTTGLCKFTDGSATGKTVWDDKTAGFYTKQDVRNMCSVALALTLGARSATEVNHVILTPLNVKICVQATKQGANFNAATGAGQGSCFPVGTAAATGLVHSAC